jgi:hypothetical protein
MERASRPPPDFSDRLEELAATRLSFGWSAARRHRDQGLAVPWLSFIVPHWRFRVTDPTDLVCLPAIAVAWWTMRRGSPKARDTFCEVTSPRMESSTSWALRRARRLAPSAVSEGESLR